MDPDKYQQAWQSDAAQTRVTINADLLLKEVQRHQGNFQATIFWRDFREVGIALLMLPLWFYLGIKFSTPWTWYLTVPVIIWGAGFIVVVRRRHPQKPSEPNETLLHCVKESLNQVEHQIWLLRNVFWWYLLPYSISIMAFFIHVCWLAASAWWEFFCGVLVFGLFLFVIYVVVYFTNQLAVRKQLEPRRQELLTLLSSLSDETSSPSASDAASYDIVPASVSPFAAERCMTPRSVAVRNVIGVLGVVGLLILMVPLIDLARRASESGYDGPPQSNGTTGDPLAELIRDQRKEKNLVGLAAMVMVDGQVEASAAHGERKAGSGVPLETGDRWHLGGITNSITATMIARLVDAGQMKWSDTIGEVFPEASVHEDWKPVTVRQLLTHTAGAPKSFSREVRKKRPVLGPECTQTRREAVLEVIADQPAYPPGEKNVYSNVSVTIAGAMVEKVSDVAWKDLVKLEVFEPLSLTGAGFGPPKSTDETLKQPRGHRTRLAGKVAVDDDADNSPIMGPSGSVHMTLRDLCTYATEHLRGDLGDGKLLSTENYELLHTPELNQYACGWIKKEPSEGIPYTLYWHNGSNTMWYAMVVFIPETGMVVAVTSNDGDYEKAEAAAWEVVKANAMPVKPPESPIYPKKSPFAAVRWQGSEPEVMLREEWFKLVLIDDLPAAEIMAFSQQTYGDQWRKRFEEDFVEILSGMKHPPRDTVTLVVQSLTTGDKMVRKGVPMTEENRNAIRAAAKKRAKLAPNR